MNDFKMISVLIMVEILFFSLPFLLAIYEEIVGEVGETLEGTVGLISVLGLIFAPVLVTSFFSQKEEELERIRERISGRSVHRKKPYEEKTTILPVWRQEEDQYIDYYIDYCYEE